MVHEERVAGSGLDGHGNAVPVMCAQRKDAEDEEVERSLEQGIA